MTYTGSNEARETARLKACEVMRRLYQKNKANPYPCPDCGRQIHKSTVSQHKRSMFHKLAVLTKQLEEQSTSAGSAAPAEST